VLIFLAWRHITCLLNENHCIVRYIRATILCLSRPLYIYFFNFRNSLSRMLRRDAGETVRIASLITLHRNCSGVCFVVWLGINNASSLRRAEWRWSESARDGEVRGFPFSRETPKCLALTCISRRKCGPRER